MFIPASINGVHSAFLRSILKSGIRTILKKQIEKKKSSFLFITVEDCLRMTNIFCAAITTMRIK